MGLFAAIMAVILYLLLFVADGLDFYLKRSFLMPQWQMMLGGLFVCLIVCMLCAACFRRQKERSVCTIQHKSLIAECLFWGALFMLQAVMSYYAYFLTDWDVGIILTDAYNMATYQNPLYLNSSYYSEHTNNVLIVEIFAAIIRIFRSFAGDPGMDRCVLILIFVQCALNTGTGMLLRQTARRLTGSAAFSVTVAALYTVFLGFTPWLMIPYSDGMTIFVPVLTLLLYQRMRESDHKILYAIAIGVAAVYGYLIKPQSVLLTIALVIYETARLVFSRRFVCFAKSIGCMLAVIALGIGPWNQAMMSRSMLNVDASRDIGMMHYFMLGMNADTRGTFSSDDLIKSLYMPQEDRTRMQFQEAIARIEDMEWSGFMELMRDKTLINFADGTFAWGINGIFFAQLIEDKDAVISPLLKSIIYTDGKYYPVFSTFLQCVWLALLLGSALALAAYAALREQKQKDALLIIMLSLIGLTVFEWIFEAKARYLFVMAPIYVLTGAMGIWYAAGRIWKMLRKER